MEKRDYSHEVNHVPSGTARLVLILLGTGFVLLGIIGIFLPVLPTTPFMLLAAWCYAKSSVRFYNWLMNNRVFGPIIREWRQYRSIPKRAKFWAIFLLVTTFSTSIVFFVPYFYLQIALGIFCIIMVIFMWRIPVREIS